MGDYHIDSGSPARDAGVGAGVTTDMDGQVRPQGAGYDIGADEYVLGDIAHYSSLAIAPDGTPYIAWQEIYRQRVE